MFQKTTQIRRALSALLLAATIGGAAASGGCGAIRRAVPWLGDEPAAAAGDPIQRRDELRERRQRAALALHEGRGRRADAEFTARDAIALSQAEQMIDAAVAWTGAPVPGKAQLADLPRKHWWYLFVEPALWARGPLAVDREAHPGYYAAMMHAFERALVGGPAVPLAALAPSAPGGSAPARAPLGPDEYAALHGLVTLGVFDGPRGRPEPQGFAAAPMMFSVAALHDPEAARRDRLEAALGELKAEGVAGWSPDLQRELSRDPIQAWVAPLLESVADVNPHGKPARLVYAKGPAQAGAADFALWLRAATSYRAGEARSWVAQWLAAYEAERRQLSGALSGAAYLDALAAAGEPGEAMLAALRPVCRLIRRLEVSHAFAAGGARLHVRLLLNKLLLDQQLPPAVIEDATSFAGRLPLEQLAREVIRGQRRFQLLVGELAARERAPGAGAAGLAVAPGAAPVSMSMMMMVR